MSGWGTQVDLVTAPLTWTRIRGHGSGSPYPRQLLSTDRIMRTDEALMTLKSRSNPPQDGGGGGLDTRHQSQRNVLSEPTWKAEGSLLPSPRPRFDWQASLTSLASPRPRFLSVIAISLRNVCGVCAVQCCPAFAPFPHVPQM